MASNNCCMWNSECVWVSTQIQWTADTFEERPLHDLLTQPFGASVFSCAYASEWRICFSFSLPIAVHTLIQTARLQNGPQAKLFLTVGRLCYSRKALPRVRYRQVTRVCYVYPLRSWLRLAVSHKNILNHRWYPLDWSTNLMIWWRSSSNHVSYGVLI